MDQVAAYLLMILCPVIPWLLKLTISYIIRFKNSEYNIAKFYKKRKISFIRKFFYVDVKQFIRPRILYYAIMLSGCILLLSIFAALIYFILALFKHTLSVFFIPDFVMRFTLVLSTILLIVGTLNNIDDKMRNK